MKRNQRIKCPRKDHSAGRAMFIGAFTAWSEKGRDDYVACMKGKGYTPTTSK